MTKRKKLSVGDLVKFTHIPKEWGNENVFVMKSDRKFMALLIDKKRWYKVTEIDEFKKPWVSIILYVKGKREHHTWAVSETTGWCSKSIRC